MHSTIHSTIHGAIHSSTMGRVSRLQLDEDEAHVEEEREGRDELERAGGGGEHGARQVHARDEWHLHIPVLQRRHARQGANAGSARMEGACF